MIGRILAAALLLTVLFLPAPGGAVDSGSPEDIFAAANQAYNEGHYQQAADGYARLIHSGHANGHVYFNLGNCYFRLDQLGKAILNYERARLTLPRDADLDYNLRYARDRAVDAIAGEQGILASTFFWVHSFTLMELFWVFAVINVLFWLAWALRLFNKREWTYYALLALLILWVMAGASFGVKWFQAHTDARAVVVQKEVDVLAGPSQGDTLLFKLHEGAVADFERSEDGWALVSLPDKKRGWVKLESVEKVRD